MELEQVLFPSAVLSWTSPIEFLLSGTTSPSSTSLRGMYFLLVPVHVLSQYTKAPTFLSQALLPQALQLPFPVLLPLLSQKLLPQNLHHSIPKSSSVPPSPRVPSLLPQLCHPFFPRRKFQCYFTELSCASEQLVLVHVFMVCMNMVNACTYISSTHYSQFMNNGDVTKRVCILA